MSSSSHPPDLRALAWRDRQGRQRDWEWSAVSGTGAQADAEEQRDRKGWRGALREKACKKGSDHKDNHEARLD